MSWDAYTQNLIDSKAVTHAAIIGTDGTVWAQSQGMNISNKDSNFIIKCLTNSTNNPGATLGVHFAGEKFMFLQASADQLQCKKLKDGLTVAKAKQCIIIGLYKEMMGQTPGNARNRVEMMRDYLQNAGY